jgi:D-alanyl-D-alanine dipeptidase
MEKGFVFLDEMLPGVCWDAKYATWDNFTGKPVTGYLVNRVAGTYELSAALQKVQEQAADLGYGLLLWDGYRPQRAVECFLRWAAQKEDYLTKDKHYPHIDRRAMIEEGYVAKKSAHSRGSTVDLTLYRLKDFELLDMGGSFDFMDSLSHHGAQGISSEAANNRRFMRSLMEKNGFAPFFAEWWHYTLKEEPYPDTYFDFPLF